MSLTRPNGYLDGSGFSPYGAHMDHNHEGEYAPKDHNHEEYALKGNVINFERFLILTTDWSEDDKATKTLTVDGDLVDCLISLSDRTAAETAGLVVDGVVDKVITFSCTTTPTDPISVIVLCGGTEPERPESTPESDPESDPEAGE